MVYLSSPSVCFGGEGREQVAEAEPVIDRPLNHYVRSKIAAEKIVQQASDLSAILLRPRAIFGPGDTTILPRIIEGLQSGKLPIIGDGKNRVNLTYIDNAVHAVECALQGSQSLSGKIFNIHDGEEVELWHEIAFVAEQLRLPMPRSQLSMAKAYKIGQLLELIHRGLRLKAEPRLTRYTATVLGQTQTLSIDAARSQLGYSPQISSREGLIRFIENWKLSNS